MDNKIRLQKYFTDCGICSRRTAEVLISQGLVKVNGEIALIGTKIDPDVDKVEYQGGTLTTEANKKTICIMLNKPRGVLCSMSDDRGRQCVRELIADVPTRVYPIGRLDLDSEGLLLFTNDGELANRLTHPKHEIPKIYHIKVIKTPTREQLKTLSSALDIDGYTIQPVKTELISIKRDYTVLKMTLFEGRNRQIRKMCENANVEIESLKRVAIGELTMGNLAKGKWRYLTPAQVAYLNSNRINKNTRS